MNMIPVKNLPRLHSTPLASVRSKNGCLVAAVDDETGRRIEIVFQPYQAFRVTTADCFILPDGVSIVPQTVVEVLDSDWVALLKLNLSQIDKTAAFMKNARHFLVPLQDDFLEVVALSVVFGVSNEGRA